MKEFLKIRMKRKNFLKTFSLTAAAVALPATFWSFNRIEQHKPKQVSTAKNPHLNYVAGAEDYPGTPVDQRGLFMNEEHIFWPSLRDVLKWQLSTNPYKDEKQNSTGYIKVINHRSPGDLPDNSITWLGHASFLIHMEGARILIDPVLGQPGFYLKRYTEFPFELQALRDIDYILISHNHRDHCDKESIELLAEQNPNTTWLCGLGLNKILENWTGSQNISAAGWYQQYDLGDLPLKISFLPTRHWSRRGLNDTNESLWGAFLLEGSDKKIYFGGDTGYSSSIFTRVNELFGEVDFYLAGIGAFAPPWFMAPSHMHPKDAAKASNEMHAKNMLPMHYGTFDLSDEPLLEPAKLIQQLKSQNAFAANLHLPAVGEVILL